MTGRDVMSDVVAWQALRFFDLADARSVVRWASEMLATGEQGSDVLSPIAGLSGDSAADVDDALAVLAAGNSERPLTRELAGLRAARSVCQEISLGTEREIEGARRLWRIARMAPEVEPELRVFVGLASEWDDDPEHREYYEEEIRSAALTIA